MMHLFNHIVLAMQKASTAWSPLRTLYSKWIKHLPRPAAEERENAAVGRILHISSIVFALFFTGAVTISLWGQDTEPLPAKPFRLGFWGGYGINTHTADFPEFASHPVFFPRTSVNQGPENFKSGLGMGLSLGVLYEMPLLRSLALTARLGYTAHDGLLTTQQRTLLGDAQGNAIDAVHEYRIQTYLGGIGADVGAKWSPLAGFYLSAGLRGAWMLQTAFAQEERLLETTPLAGQTTTITGGFDRQTFSRVRNEQQGAIPAIASVQLFAQAALGYEIPLGFMRLAPEVGYVFGLTNLVSNGSLWRTNQLRAGIAAIFTFQPLSNGALQMSGDALDDLPESRTIPRSVPQDSTTIAAATSSTSGNPNANNTSSSGVSANGATNNASGTTTSAVRASSVDVEARGIVRVARRALKGRTDKEFSEEKPTIDEKQEKTLILPKQEVVVRHNYSLLPYIFFDGDRSAVLPQRYARLSTAATAAFAPEQLRPSTTLIAGEHPYYHLLNIIGARMRRLPLAKLNILGGIDAASGERDNLKLARNRASSVAMYLRTVWGIDSARLVMGEARLTAKSSRSFNEQDRQAENRRVELSSDTTALLEPIQLTDTVQRQILPRLRLFPTLKGDDDVISWQFALRQEGRIIKELRGDGALPKELDWRTDERESAELRLALPLEIALTTRTKSGAALTAPLRTIPLQSMIFRSADEEYCANFLIEKYNLILFDATKSAVAQSQATTLKSMNTRITAKSTVLVEGFMDKSDDEEANKRLSRARAQSAAQSLKFLARGAQIDVQGYGSQKTLYDERLPEGRIYTRTVLITIETPLGEDWQK
jgi:outer membrane protein OmpA-like peptidoglycan-associated protein